MSKEYIRKEIEKRFHAWNGLSVARKSYQNDSEPTNRDTGIWAHLEIVHVMRKITSIGENPCTTRTGTVMIYVYGHLGEGTAEISRKTDELEKWFSFHEADNLWLDAAITIDAGAKNGYYQSVVYVPFTYSD